MLLHDNASCTQCDPCAPNPGSEDDNCASSSSLHLCSGSCGLLPVSPLTAIKGADVNSLKDRVTAVPRSIPQEIFADFFRKLYECCQTCVVANGE